MSGIPNSSVSLSAMEVSAASTNTPSSAKENSLQAPSNQSLGTSPNRINENGIASALPASPISSKTQVADAGKVGLDPGNVI
ncbi:MAG: hypothetical protein K9M81_03015 [Chthoniobacterales bacterium]|nr:hypothetical protein [Chthoniobacterales bacterium]